LLKLHFFTKFDFISCSILGQEDASQAAKQNPSNQGQHTTDIKLKPADPQQQRQCAC